MNDVMNCSGTGYNFNNVNCYTAGGPVTSYARPQDPMHAGNSWSGVQPGSWDTRAPPSCQYAGQTGHNSASSAYLPSQGQLNNNVSGQSHLQMMPIQYFNRLSQSQGQKTH